MPAKIRLARHGRKGHAFYHIVVADSRAPRDGKYIDRLGSYDPNTTPATITIDFEKALSWLNKGAQPTDTANSLLRREGVLYKRHLLKGVEKGAFAMEVAEQRFQEWVVKRENQESRKAAEAAKTRDAAAKARLEAEQKINEARQLKINEVKAAKAKAEAEKRAAEEAAAAEAAAQEAENAEAGEPAAEN